MLSQNLTNLAILAIPILLMLFVPYFILKKLSTTNKGQAWVKKQFWLNPNVLSTIRYPMGVISMVFYYISDTSKIDWIKYFAILWFSWWIITDLLDGLIARNFNLLSEKGKILDPLSDKLMLFPPLFYFAWTGLLSMLWVIVFFIFDILGQSSRFFITNTSANLFGKAKTPMTAFVLFLVVISDLKIVNLTYIQPGLISICLYATVVLAGCSLLFKITPTYWYANILSLMNLSCGIIGIILILFYNDLELAFAACFIGQFLDLFDGRAAMKWGSTPKGAWFDTMGDAVNFGGVGGLLIYVSFTSLWFAIPLSVLYLGSTLFRLIRYTVGKKDLEKLNKQEKERASLVFDGLPSPAGMLFIGCATLLFLPIIIKVILIVIISVLMISKIRFAHFGRLILPSLSTIQTLLGLLIFFIIIVSFFLTENTHWLYSCLLISLLAYLFYSFIYFKNNKF